VVAGAKGLSIRINGCQPALGLINMLLGKTHITSTSYSMHLLHPVFNAIKFLRALRDLISGRCPNPPPNPEIINGELEYEVEAILDS
jgi:hypothetical protein